MQVLKDMYEIWRTIDGAPTIDELMDEYDTAARLKIFGELTVEGAQALWKAKTPGGLTER